MPDWRRHASRFMKLLARVLPPLLWAAMERGMPRLASAVVLLAFARYTGPAEVGVYGWIALAYTFYQALAENALRTQAVMYVANPADARDIHAASRRAAWSGSGFLLLTLLLLWRQVGDDLLSTVTALLPFLAVPFITSSGVIPVARLQLAHEWRTLARCQVSAACTGLVVSGAVMWVTHSALALSSHIIVTEGFFRVWVGRRAARVTIETAPERSRTRSESRQLTVLGVLAWTQGQLERVFIGSLSGLAVLGMFATAATIGRSPGEALSAATSNYLRASLSRAETDAAAERVIRTIGSVAVLLALVAAVMVTALVDLVLVPILGPSWKSTLDVVPLLAVSTIPFVVSNSLQILAVFNKRPVASIAPAVAGATFALPVGLVAMDNLFGAAAIIVVKSVTVLMVAYMTSRVKGAREPVALALVVTVVSTAGVWLVR